MKITTDHTDDTDRNTDKIRKGGPTKARVEPKVRSVFLN
jgi:hypothetical protein